jgi:hypothetical protein
MRGLEDEAVEFLWRELSDWSLVFGGERRSRRSRELANRLMNQTTG